MKKILAIVLFSLATVSAQAAEPSKWTAATTNAQKLKDVKANYRAVCEGLADRAATIMGMRQDNRAMGWVMKAMESRTGGNEYEHIVIDAYEVMYWHRLEPATMDEISKFANKWELICIKSLR